MDMLKLYKDAIRQQNIKDSKAQRQVIPHLQRIVDALSAKPNIWLRRKRRGYCIGVYLYGSVGVGKTFLIDLFYHALPIAEKKRIHFHHFMQQIDYKLRQLQGKKNPLAHFAAQFAKTTRVLCLDEFLVHDITEAMILANLLEALFANGVILVATSNTKPDELYLHGLQRARFLPAIELIKTHCEILYLSETRDYRLGRKSLKTYFYPLNVSTDQALLQLFKQLEPESKEEDRLLVQGRPISFVRLGQKSVWFTFEQLCHIPRSQLDYLEIAQRFKTVFLSHIPRLSPKDLPQVILLMHFIDVMYDQGVHVIFSAAVPPDELYQSGPMHQAFARTLSRLHEMQSEDYLSRHGQIPD